MFGFVWLRGFWIRPLPPPLHRIVFFCNALGCIVLHCTAVTCTALPRRCAGSCRVSRLVGFLGVSCPIIWRRGTLRVTSARVLWMCHCFAWCRRLLPRISALGRVACHAWFISWARHAL